MFYQKKTVVRVYDVCQFLTSKINLFSFFEVDSSLTICFLKFLVFWKQSKQTGEMIQ